MILTLLLSALAIVTCAFTVVLGRAALARRVGMPATEALALGAVTNFFDTLGIGSFAPTMAWMKFRSMIPDRIIPSTMLAGYTLPTMAQAAIFLVLLGVSVEPWLLLGSVVAFVPGALFGASLAAKAPVRLVQAIVGIALLIAAWFYVVSNMHWMPEGGTASGLDGWAFWIAIGSSFLFAVLLNFGVGHYAPTLAMLSLLGLDPRLAFPIMASTGAFGAAAAAAKVVRRPDIDVGLVVGLTVGAIPAVLIAAFVVKEMPVETMRWFVVAIIVYAAAVLLRQATRLATELRPLEPLAEGLID